MLLYKKIVAHDFRYDPRTKEDKTESTAVDNGSEKLKAGRFL